MFKNPCWQWHPKFLILRADFADLTAQITCSLAVHHQHTAPYDSQPKQHESQSERMHEHGYYYPRTRRSRDNVTPQQTSAAAEQGAVRQAGRVGHRTGQGAQRLGSARELKRHEQNRQRHHLLLYRFELLYPSPPVSLSNVNIAFGIDRQGVSVCEFTNLVTRSAEA
jgi:hypothetical protein